MKTHQDGRWIGLGAALIALVVACASTDAAPPEVQAAAHETVVITAQEEAPRKKPHEDLQYPPLREVKVPPIRREVLSNGMILFLLEDHELPLVNVKATVRTGSAYDLPDLVGLASITGTVMRTGGTPTRPGDDLDEMLEEIGASVETDIGATSGGGSLSCLKENFPEVLEIFAEILMNPAFPEEKIELAKVEQRTAISRRNDDPMDITAREFMKLVYGADSPYARHTEYVTIDAIQREHLVRFHEMFFHPDQTILGVWGDINPDEVLDRVEKAFASWERSPYDPPPPLPEAVQADTPKVNYVRKTDVNQTNIRIGHLGIRRDDPDYYSVVVLNHILGSGFSARLFETVRSKMGLAYMVGSFARVHFDRPGLMALYCLTKSETTHAAIAAMFGEVEKIRTEEVTDEELTRAKESPLNSFVFNFDSMGEILGRRMDFEYYGYPPDLLEEYQAKIGAVTKADVLAAARKHIRPEDFKILAVGREEDFDKPLSVFGEVAVIDIESALIPPEPEFPEATPETMEQGLSLLAEAAEAHGGEAKIAEIQGYELSGTVTATVMPGAPPMELGSKIAVQYPDRLRAEFSTPMGAMVQIVNGDQGWMQMGGQTRPIPASDAKKARGEIFRTLIGLLRDFRSEGITVQALPDEGEGVQTATVLVRAQSGSPVKALLSKESKTLVGMAYTQEMPGKGPVQVEETFADFREVSGILIPFKRETKEVGSGQVLQSVEVSEFSVNPELDEKMFEIEEEAPGEQEE